jgi:co-chaperonin GroES (HSP10)
MIQLEPLHDRVVIKRTEEAEETLRGLFIPDTAKEKPQQGEAIAVGAGQILESGKRIPLDLKVGDHELNKEAFARLRCKKEMKIVPGATRLFEEPGALEQASRLAAEWFKEHLQAQPRTSAVSGR